MVKNLPVNAGDTDLIPDLGRSHMPQSVATKPTYHNYQVCTQEPGTQDYCSHALVESRTEMGKAYNILC